MPAYFRARLADFISIDPDAVVGQLETNYARDGFNTQFSQQTLAWAAVIPLLQNELRLVLSKRPEAREWTILLEFPLYRLRKRLDIVILSEGIVVVIEAKVGESRFRVADQRQVEEYALDLRDFHAGTKGHFLLPVLWCTGADDTKAAYSPGDNTVAPICFIGRQGLGPLLGQLPAPVPTTSRIVGEAWDASEYRPVPNVIQAATSIFAGHDVRSIAQADASNLKDAATRLVQLIVAAREEGRRALLFLTGVPGSGKTLAGLHVVHDAIATGAEQQGDIVYLSGNTPLVTVLREALARDEYGRMRNVSGDKSLQSIRRDVRARIQHINDFLKQSLRAAPGVPPHEHALVFDEAQRAWDEAQGEKKFERNASEPTLLLELLSRHSDWCTCVCLVGGGQEINSGEQGVLGWGEALRKLDRTTAAEWSVHAPADVLRGGPSTGGLTLGQIPPQIDTREEPELQLRVPLRTYRAPALNEWVSHVLDGEPQRAAVTARSLRDYPIVLTRSLEEARHWLRQNGRGQRRYGLVASSGARRLRAEGLGVLLNATDGIEIAQWYLNEPGDIRASYALEVPANEYTCQGLELDFVAVCWGGNLVRDRAKQHWMIRRLNGTRWQTVNDGERRRFISNSYRVLLTRAREGMIIWVPRGDSNDSTREPGALQTTADFLLTCGAAPL
jgi:DUF2075 family protein